MFLAQRFVAALGVAVLLLAGFQAKTNTQRTAVQWNNLGVAYMDQQKLNEAQSAFEHAHADDAKQVLPLLNKHGLIWLTAPNFQAHGGEIQPNLSYRLIHAESGEETSGTVPLMLSKRDPQGLGSAITYARRYAWQSVLGIAAEEDTDGPADPDAEIPF